MELVNFILGASGRKTLVTDEVCCLRGQSQFCLVSDIQGQGCFIPDLFLLHAKELAKGKAGKNST